MLITLRCSGRVSFKSVLHTAASAGPSHVEVPALRAALKLCSVQPVYPVLCVTCPVAAAFSLPTQKALCFATGDLPPS